MSQQKYSNLIQINAESIGIKTLDNEIIDYLSIEVEEKIKSILSQAKKFMRVSKRKTLKVDDLNHSLRFFNFKPLLGYDSYGNAEYERIDAANGLWRPKQNIIDLEEYLSKPIASCPMDIINHFHWISIDGKRPNIPENFIREEQKVILPTSTFQKETHSSTIEMPNVQTTTGNQPASKTKIVPLVIHNISKELQIFLENFEQRFRKEVKNVKLCPNTNFIMSKELEISLNVIENEPGVVELLPYIIELLMTNMSNKMYLKDPKVHMITLHYLDSILKNPYFYLETYLHQFITISLSLILMEHTGDNIETSINVKDFAIRIMKQIYTRYDIRYPNFINQLLDLYKVNILPQETMNNYMTVYGAIKALNSLGPLHVIDIILPRIGEIFNNITVVSTDGLQISLRNFVEKREKKLKQVESKSQNQNILSFSMPQFLTIPLSHSIFSDISNMNSINNNFEKNLEDENKLINNLIKSHNINQNTLRKAFYAYYALKESASLILNYASELEPSLAKPIFQKLNEVFGESLIPNFFTSENESNGTGLDLII